MTLPDHTREWLIQMDDFKDIRPYLASQNGLNFLTVRAEDNTKRTGVFRNSSKNLFFLAFTVPLLFPTHCRYFKIASVRERT